MANSLKHYIRAFWHFIWEEDSLLSWIVNIILAFILIKYVLFPVLGLFFGSKYPLVAVVSSSMEHDGKFDNWWSSQKDFYADFNITKEQFRTFTLKNGFEKGDVMVLVSAENIKIGDIIVFFSHDGRPIIHRVINLDPLQTKGDHNAAQISDNQINEKNVVEHPIIGKAVLRIPLLGYVKIIFAWLVSLFGFKVA